MRQDELDFLAKCRALNETLRQLQEQGSEPITEQRVLESIVLIRQLKLVGLGDAFRYLAALNCVNAYQSLKDSEDLESFYKDYYQVLARFLKKDPSELVRMEIQTEQYNTLYFEIAEVQFSFSNVKITKDLEDLLVKDSENPEIEWDGIRKKRCVETVCVFAEENTWESNHLSMDGGDIDAVLQKAADDYQKGQLTLREAAGLKEKNQSSGEKGEKESVEVEDDTYYPYRYTPINVLYSGMMKAFLEGIRDRRLVDYLIRNYEEGYGYQVNDTSAFSWKYQFEALRHELEKGSISDGAAVLLLMVHNAETNYYILLIGSKDEEGEPHVCGIQLFGWTKAVLKEDSVNVLCRTRDMQVDAECLHPSLIMAAFRGFLLQGIFDAERIGYLKTFTFLYDCIKKDETDIVTGFDKEILEKSDIVYADDEEKFTGLIKDAVSGFDGTDLMNYVSDSIGKYLNNLEPEDLPDFQYVSSKIREKMESEDSFLTIVQSRFTNNKISTDSIAETFRESGRSCFIAEEPEALSRIPGNTDVICYLWFIPESLDFSSAAYHIILIDSHTVATADLRRLEQLCAQDMVENKVHAYRITNCPAFCDLGGGNNWLIRFFTLGAVYNQIWDPSNYSITAISNASDFSGKEGCALVTVPEGFSYDPETKMMTASEADRIRLYQELHQGEKGVELLIADEQLRIALEDRTKNYFRGYYWISEFQRTETSDEEVMQARRDIYSESSQCLTMEAIIRAALGNDAYDKLSEDSQSWLLSALLSYYDMRTVSQIMDYTGVVLMICKCYEVELCARLADEMVKWAKETYGDDYISHLPQGLLNSKKNYQEVIDFKDLSIGSYTYIMGYYPDGGVYSKSDKEKFLCYAQDRLLADPENAESTIKSFVKIITNVRTKYRNKAAHTETIDVVLATECVEYCVTVDRTLGVFLDACNY